MDEAQTTVPATSTMALSFAEVRQHLPAGVTLEQSHGVIELTIKLKGLVPALGIAFGGLVLIGYLGLYVTSTTFLTAAMAVGLYFAVAFAIGRRRVTVETDRLGVRTLPFPLPGDGTTNIDDVEALEVVVVGVRSRPEAPWYRIDVLNKGRRRPLVQDIRDEEQALVLARFLARELRVPLPDRALRLT